MNDKVKDDNPINIEQINNRWRVRRRLSISAFIVVTIIGLQAAFGKIESSSDIVIAVIYGMVAIVLVYIAGPIVDDWLQSKKK